MLSRELCLVSPMHLSQQRQLSDQSAQHQLRMASTGHSTVENGYFLKEYATDYRRMTISLVVSLCQKPPIKAKIIPIGDHSQGFILVSFGTIHSSLPHGFLAYLYLITQFPRIRAFRLQ